MNVKLPKIFKFNQPLELPPQLQWHYAHEPELMAWTIKARNYNTFVANCMFWFCFIAIITISISTYLEMSYAPVFGGVGALILFAVTSTALISTTHQTMNFAYRFTASGVECCEWKDFPRWALTFTKWFAGITTVIFVALAFIDPAFLIVAFVGPGGMSLMYLSMVNSKNYQSMHTQYHHLIYEWKDFTQLAVATNRNVVDLQYTQHGKETISWHQNIFCKRKQKENVADFIREFLPSEVPFVRAKVNVPMSTA